MTNAYDYLIARYGKGASPNLIMMIEELQEKVEILEQNYKNVLVDIKRLEEENIETSNALYELENSIEAMTNDS